MDVKWITFFETLGATTSAAVLLLIVLGYFGKQMIVYFFSESIEFKKLELNKALENHRSELNSKSEEYKTNMSRLLEAYKSDLSLSQTKSSKLYDKQSEIIAELFKHIINVDNTFSDMTSYFHLVKDNAEVEEGERITKAADAYNNFVVFYSERSIFFSEDLCRKIDKFRDIVKSVHFDYNNSKFFTEELREKVAKLDSARTSMKEVVPGILDQLRSDFRALLSVR